VGGIVAGLAGLTLPLSSRGAPPLGLGGSEDAGAILTAFTRGLGARPELPLTAVTIGLLAALAPLASRRGPWPLAVLGALSLALLLLPVGAVQPLPVVAGIWLCCAVLTAGDLRRRS